MNAAELMMPAQGDPRGEHGSYIPHDLVHLLMTSSALRLQQPTCADTSHSLFPRRPLPGGPQAPQAQIVQTDFTSCPLPDFTPCMYHLSW